MWVDALYRRIYGNARENAYSCNHEHPTARML